MRKLTHLLTTPWRWLPLALGIALAAGMVSVPIASAAMPTAPANAIRADSPSEEPCGADEECVSVDDEVDLYEELSPTPLPTPTGVPTVPPTVAANPVAAAAAQPPVRLPCGHGLLRGTLRRPAGNPTALLAGQFTVVSFIGAPMNVTAFRNTTANGVALGLNNDGGLAAIPVHTRIFIPRVVNVPVVATITEGGLGGAGVSFTVGLRGCRAPRVLSVTLRM